MSKKRMTLPKAVALTAFVVYALTASHGMTVSSMAMTAKITGWDWLPMTTHPLTWLLTLPLHLLPAGRIPLALNLFSALTAAVTLGLLARCAELLPRDAQPDAKKPWVAKLPVLLAVAVCGFEFSFWQEATAATGEMTDLLLLAAAGWCLLEYRAGKNLRWLDAAAVIWGIGMAENWFMLAALPIFAVALVVLRGIFFFKIAFARRMALLGLAGFSLYALLPLAHWLTPHSPLGFAEAWHAAFHSTKEIFSTIYSSFWQQHRLLIVAVGLYFLVPILPCFLRFNTQSSGHISELDRFQLWLFRTLSVALLLACLWLAFDPIVGPREIVRKQLGFAMPLLSFDLMDALGAAFILGNLLSAAQVPSQRWARNLLDKLMAWLQQYAAPLLAGISAVAIAGLVARNLPAVLAFNREPLSGYGSLIARSLPAAGGIVFGEDPAKLILLQATLTEGKQSGHWQFINLALLSNPKYRALLGREYPADWSGIAKESEIKPDQLLQLVDSLARTNRIFFLQPQNGSVLFERVYPSPLGAMHELKHYPAHSFAGAALTAAEISGEEKFWDDAWQNGLAALDQTPPRPSGLDRLLKRRLTIQPARRDQNVQLGRWYSVLLNDWGVDLQQAGQLSAAQRRFQQALLLNTDNMAAATNLNCCTDLLAGKKLVLLGPDQVADKFRSIRVLAQLINVYGEFDDPGIRYALGNTWLSANLPHQAWQEFEHARILAPDAILPQLAKAQLYSHFRFDTEVFETVGRLRPLVTDSPAGQSLEVDLAILEAKSWISQNNPERANRTLEKLLLAHPESSTFQDMVLKAYLSFGEVSNAMAITEARLAKDPDNVAALNNKAALLIQSKKAEAAIPVLNRVMTLTNLPSIRLNRAIAYLQLTNLPAAEQDYTQLVDTVVDQFSVNYGLGQIALDRGDTNTAVHYFGLCLTNAPANSPRWQEIRARMDLLAH
ncbi:MAG TPA: tetratricopeptide repeat protein [Verrucomicrobiae bacterium]|nr:tetratricopeptide repeat protein [Verrucomicrobiae bacterium]